TLPGAGWIATRVAATYPDERRRGQSAVHRQRRRSDEGGEDPSGIRRCAISKATRHARSRYRHCHLSLAIRHCRSSMNYPEETCMSAAATVTAPSTSGDRTPVYTGPIFDGDTH